MGFNHHVYNERQKILLISRLLPMVEARYNLIELAPKGTGKSFVFENLSRYVAVRSGAISAPVLFFNDARKTPGLITRFDCVVIDEAQKVRGDSSGELTALLKSYLESGRFGRGSAGSITSEAGLVMLANIELDEDHRPINEYIGILRTFPNFLRETAFIDRFSGLLPGWDIPRVTKESPASSIALKGDIFGEILHMLRNDISFRDYVKTNMDIQNCDDMRDNRAIEAGASGYLKLLFPDLQLTEEDFYKYCVNPAIELRQRVHDELCKMDREYRPVSMRSKIPDTFQLTHRPPEFVDQNDIEPASLKQISKPIKDVVPDIEEPEDIYPTTTEPELAEKTIHIQEGEMGYSYKSLFGDYLKGASSIHLIDPYVRMEFQVRNLLAFTGIIDTVDGSKELLLTTSSDDEYQQKSNSQKFDEIANGLADHGINFKYEFNNTTHRRGIELDNGWRIIIDRGLDIYQKPDSKYELSEIDQTKKKCRETEVTYIHNSI